MRLGKWRYLGFVCWLLGLCGGMAAMLSHDYATADTGRLALHRPDATVPVPAGHHALYMFVHPQCPCTRASIAQLADVLPRMKTPVSAQVYFYSPASQPLSWVEAAHWQAAGAIPGVHRLHDSEGTMAAQCNALISGYTLLYDAGGKLLFAGGLTASRGQTGASIGSEALLKLADGETLGLVTAPAFGCSLRGPSANTE